MSQNDFITRLGQWVLRKDPVGNERTYKLFKPEDPAKYYVVAQYYMALQTSGVKFKPLLRVQSVANDSCESCSA